jgi:DNA processing protein
VTAQADLPIEAFAAALAELPGMGPARLVRVLRDGPPDVAWQQVLDGELRRAEPSPRVPEPTPGARASWAELAARWDVARRWSAIEESGIRVTHFGGEEFPEALLGDPDPPGVLFWLGDLAVLGHRRVAIIGTRQCTNYGRTVALEVGRDLAECGVCVISGLALGIDGAAHQGALLASEGVGPVGVAASGVDTPYPRKHRELWRRVAETGAVMSETAPGRPAQSWRFPARNRIIAGLAEAVVVVESHAGGGSMLTVAAAADRGIDVLAVPGPVTSPSSVGTNQLLYEGVAPVRHAGDVLAALGDLRSWPAVAPPGADRKPAFPQGPDVGRRPARADRERISGHDWQPPRPAPDSDRQPARSFQLEPSDRRVLGSIDRTSSSTSVIAERSGLPIGALSVVLLRLEGLGLVRGHGMWWERCDGQ